MNRDVSAILDGAGSRGRLDEYESKLVLAACGIPVTREMPAANADEARRAAEEIGFPVVLKVCAAEIAHKSEQGLVRVNIRNAGELAEAAAELEPRAKELGGQLLVQEMVAGARELVMGLIRDPQFGPCVMFGLGGIFTEVLKDTSFRVAPIEKYDALQMMDEIQSKDLLGPFRGKEAVDRDQLAGILIAVGDIGMKYDDVMEIDINPVKTDGSRPVAVDALVVLGNGTE